MTIGKVKVELLGAKRVKDVANALAAAADKCRIASIDLAVDMNRIIEEEKAEDAKSTQDNL